MTDTWVAIIALAITVALGAPTTILAAKAIEDRRKKEFKEDVAEIVKEELVEIRGEIADLKADVSFVRSEVSYDHGHSLKDMVRTLVESDNRENS